VPGYYAVLLNQISILLPSHIIIDSFPGLQDLPPERKLALAVELLDAATEDAGASEPDPEIVDALRQRLEIHENTVNGGRRWSEVRNRILASRAS